MLQLTASPWTTEASTRERWQSGALTNKNATSSNRASSLSSLCYDYVALSLYRDNRITIIRLWWLSQRLVAYGHHLAVTIYLYVAPSSRRHTNWTYLKIWAPLRNLFAPSGVPSWLRAWAKPSDGLAFLTNNRDVTLILRWLSTSCSKRNADWILSFNCARRYFVKSKFGYWHPLICSYESSYILLVDFVLFNRHNQWYSRGQHYTALRFPLLLMFIENCLVKNSLTNW